MGSERVKEKWGVRESERGRWGVREREMESKRE